MEIRLEDLQTEQMHVIGEDGATLGRDSRRSSIAISDPGVSGAHARIFARSGRYFIEDINSSNGTYADGARLRGELELRDGLVIALHKYKFRVVVSAGEEQSVGDSTALFEPKSKSKSKTAMTGAQTRTQHRERLHAPPHEESTDENDRSDIDEAIARPMSSSWHRAANVDRSGSAPSRADERDVDEDEASEPGDAESFSKQSELSESQPQPRPMKRRASHISEISQIEESDSLSAPADMRGGFGTAIAYYLAAVPKMALMPGGATQQMVNEQPFKPMEKMELALWATPPLALGAIVSLLSALVVSLVVHSFGIGTLLRPIITGAVVVVVGSLFFGWAWHPLTEWLVRVLKGDSDSRSRTNYMITTLTSTALVYIAGGIGVLFTLLLRVPHIGPFMQIVPLLLQTVASLLALYVVYAWLVHFRVHEIVGKVVQVLGVVLIALGMWGMIGLIRAGVSSGGAVAATTADAAKATKFAMADTATTAAQAQAAAQAMANAHAAQAAETTQAVEAAAQSATSAAPGAQAAPTERSTPAAAPTTPVTPTAQATPPPQSAAAIRVEARDEDDEQTPRKARADAEASLAPTRPTFAVFKDHSDAIEKMVASDPSLLSRVPGALNLYKKLHATAAKFKPKGKTDAATDHIQKAELYAATVDIVEELYAKIAAP